MKKITIRRRMLSLTLAASVALPQASSAFATSLWNENGENDHISHVIESSQPDTPETPMPWITLLPDDNTGRAEQSPTVSPDPTPAVDPDPSPTPVTNLPLTISPDPSPTPTPAPSPENGSDQSGTPGDDREDPADVVTPVDKPQDDPGIVPIPPTFAEDPLPSKEVEEPTLSTSETIGGEELEMEAEEMTTALATAADGADFVMPYSAPEGVTLTQWMSYRLGYGVPTVQRDADITLGEDFKHALPALREHFAVETSEGKDSYAPVYGYRDYSSALSVNVDGGFNNGYSFCVFPTAEALGRVPDQQFAGWYVYPTGVKANQSESQAAQWVFGDLVTEGSRYTEADMRLVTRYPYGTNDLGHEQLYVNWSDNRTLWHNYTFGELGDTWDGGCDYGYGYVYRRDENGNLIYWAGSPMPGDWDINPVSFVGKWEASDESRADTISLFTGAGDNKTALPLYGSSIAGKLLSGSDAVEFDLDTHEYWLRVDADVDSLSLNLSTLELYYADYDYNAAAPDDYSGYRLNAQRSHVKVTTTFADETAGYTDDLSAWMLPAWTKVTDNISSISYCVPQNSLDEDKRAHSEWSVTGISLKNAVPGSLYNDITVSVTSPSGKVTTTYTFHVQRLTEPTLTQAWGNTPVGMIRRDAGALSSADAKKRAEEQFLASRSFDPDLYPNGSANQNGTIFRDTYFSNAWVAKDVDIDPTAIIVYQDSIFKDPGISLIGTMGEAVDISKGTVSRSLQLRRVDSLSPTQIGKVAGETCWYQSGRLVTASEAVFETISLADGSDAIDLRGLNILPGIYTLEYHYTDPISGKSYGSDANDYVTSAGKASAATFRRTLVVLPTPGDVDMDGAVTMADSLALRQILGKDALDRTTLNGVALGDTSGTSGAESNVALVSLFAYRVCDINHDGAVDDKDITLLAQLPNPKPINERNASNSDYYYIALPTGTTGDRYTRQSFATVTTEDAPMVEMVYLGKEGGLLREGGFTDSPTGPWASDTDAGIEMEDIFWLGVKLKNSSELNLDSVKSLTFTLTYDTRYVTPVVVLNETNWATGITGNETAAEQTRIRWETMMSLYNLGIGSSEHTVWGKSAYGYEFTDAAGWGERFTTHYSTARIPLESVLSETATERERLQTITFSVELKNGYSPILLQNGNEYLFALPFRMERHPFGQQTARLVEFEAGMRGFTLVTTESNAASIGTAYAYSCQDKIFGGATRNLAGILPYGNLGAEVPLGEDKTEVYQIYNFKFAGPTTENSKSTTNGVYASAFLSRGGWTSSGEYQTFTLNAELQGALPPGLTYHITNGYIDGIPEKAGTYEFYIGNIPYRLVVDKADLRFWADSQSSYYGQPEFRGAPSDDFTFKYAIDDICSFERKRAEQSGGTIKLDGRGENLVDLLDDALYRNPINQPAFTAVTEDDKAVTNATPVGTYAITNPRTPMSTNYNFVYSPELAGGQGLAVMARPIQVVNINGTETDPAVVGFVYNDQIGTLGNLKAQQGSDVPAGQVSFTVRLATSVTDDPGYYNGYPLTANGNYTDGVIVQGDLLEITYTADYIRNQKDIDTLGGNSAFFYLDGNREEYRDVRAQSIRLTGGTGSGNYRLVSNVADKPVMSNCVVGRVILRQILKLEISQMPPLEYQYGDRFNRSNELHYFILKEGDVQEGQYAYSDRSIAELGITAYWATAEEKEAYERGDLTYDYGADREKYQVQTGQSFTTDYNGRYICLTTPTIGNVVIRCYAEEPLVIKPRTIVLTATAARRYYGEENGNLTFTYDPAQLAAIDYRQGLTGAGEELLEILKDDNYSPPTLEALVAAKDPDEVTDADRLTAASKYTGSANSVIIYGASSDNYHFLYRYTDTGGVSRNQEKYGASTYRIERRPIVLQEITTNDPLVEIYADTHRIYTDNLTLSLAKGDVSLTLPQHTATSTEYYPATGSATARRENIGLSTETAVVNEDSLSFTYTATVVPTDGSSYVRYTDFSRGYFNMDDTPERGYKEYPVQVSNLRLTGDDANNYVLVYKTADRGVMEMPQEIQVISNGVEPEVNAGKTYYAASVVKDGVRQAAVGRVWLRPIDSIQISTTGRLVYTYGETYDPSQGDKDSQNRMAMTIHIEYVNDPRINNFEGNPYIGDVTFRVAGAQNGNIVTTFDNRSLKIYYVKPGQEVEAAVKNPKQRLGLQEALYVAEHNGARLVVTGQRGGQEELIVSAPTRTTLQITPKVLTLRGEDQRRVYGEENPNVFGFTFPAGELARWDRETLGSNISIFDRLSGDRLSELGLAYTAPTFGTAATPASDVRNGGQEGYDITLAANGEGSLENYILQYEPGTLYIYPRPIRIDSFISSGTDPIYTIFSDVTARKFWTNVDEQHVRLLNASTQDYELPGGTKLPVSEGALRNGDTLTLRIQVAYPDDLNLKSDEAKGDIPVQVLDASIASPTRAVSNYVLETRGVSGNEVAVIETSAATGRVELRDITNISVTQIPDKLHYTYGEALDLSGLQVTISYNIGTGTSTGQTTVVDYMGPEQFEQYGLYVNYYDSSSPKVNEYWGDIRKNYRTAATGDHLTIAPTHDSQLSGQPFWADGKYLVITAQRHEEQKAAEPQVIPTPIRVDPLPITFTLSAEDKIYNGNTQAAGSITFTNIFNRSGYVDSKNTAGVTDLVYPVLGATYEERWGNQYSRPYIFSNFISYLAERGGRYTFTTGRYVENDPAEPTTNKEISWTDGYTYGTAGTLTFSYLDPNVAYLREPEHDYYGTLDTKAVQVTGLRLAGPDAANYTLVGQAAGQTVEVTTNNVSTAKGYQGSGLPTATIHKANRTDITTQLLPQVEIDPHTNVVRINYDQGLSAILGGEESDYLEELHFEFALQQFVIGQSAAAEQPDLEEPEGEEEGQSEEESFTVSDILQWAGKNGRSEWADPRYFGGEAAPRTGPLEITREDLEEAEDYVPREEDLPKEDSVTENTTIKGQVYQWSELDDGFRLSAEVYPGGVIWPGYELYTTDRTALIRDAYYLPVVRAAETHNYNASRALSSVEEYTSAMIQALLDARRAEQTAMTSEDYAKAQEDIRQAVAAAGEAVSQAIQKAGTDAQDEVDALLAAGEKDSKLEERPQREAAPVVKTYKQAIEIVSIKALRSAEAEDKDEPYQVPTLEAIWFTDVQELSSKEVLDAVVWNIDPVRYRRYGWDSELSVELDFEDEEAPISLERHFEVTITTKGENGGEDEERTLWVNEDHNVRIYADITFPSSGGNIKPELMVLRPGSIMTVVGGEPVTPEITFYPSWAKATTILWASSDPNVAMVDDTGQITFVGVGTAVITATVPGSYLGAPPACGASITVTVVADWKEEYPNSIFDFGYLESFLVSAGGDGREGDKLFLPEEHITRGETARLLVQFYVKNPSWSKIGPEDFPDLTGEEDYAEAAKLLGSLGVFMGYPEGEFAGEQYINRAEFVTLLARMTGLNIVDTAGQPHAFLDTGEEDTWAYSEIDAMSWQTTGVLLGVGEGYFAPGREITRSEVAALLTRLLRFPMTQTGELVVPIDVEEDHWARDCILRAVNGSHVLEESLVEEIQDQ